MNSSNYDVKPTWADLRKLDAWIDVNIFNSVKRCLHLNVFQKEPPFSSLCICEDCEEEFGQTTLAISRGMIQGYSSDSSASMEVLKACSKKLENDRAFIGIEPYSDIDGFQGWKVEALYRTMNQRTFAEVAETLELAICLFAKTLYSKDAK
jgi:hypothetical protein